MECRLGHPVNKYIILTLLKIIGEEKNLFSTKDELQQPNKVILHETWFHLRVNMYCAQP